MICRICGGKDIAEVNPGRYICLRRKGFFNNPHMLVRACQRCGVYFLTIPSVENTVLWKVLRTKSNVKTYWRMNRCPACIIQSIRESYVRRYGKDWNRFPLDWWAENDEATITLLVRWGLDKVHVTRYELESPGLPECSPIPSNFIDFCLAEA